ncbi:MAG TPA: DUF6089 family protein [Chitinophagales bacterium]|nr:DUF6089 family protein [Chitinophagales bacterium]
MKRIVSILCALCFLTAFSFAQTMEAGFGIGVTNFLGDLGKKEPNGRGYYGDIEASLFRPALSIFFRNNFNYFFALKGAVTYGVWEGDDRLSHTKKFMDDAWFRSYRNLHFKSNVMELSFTGEVNFMRYIPGSGRNWISPYFVTGVSFVYFNPKAEYNGEWIALQPLGTEGQGMPQYPDRKPYSLFQPAVPIGIGLKVNVSRFLTVGLEFAHRFTFTDYLDDVSLTYVSEQEFMNFHGDEKGALAYELSRRSSEVDPEETYGYITQPGEVRGNPGNNDAYLFSTVTLSYKFANKFSEFSYSHKRNTVRKNPARHKKIKKYRRFVRNKTW